MTAYFTVIAVLLLVTLLAGLGRVLRGPSAADRMLSAQLFGTAGVGVLVLLSVADGRGALLDVALVLALLAPLAVIVFTRLPGGER